LILGIFCPLTRFYHKPALAGIDFLLGFVLYLFLKLAIPF
jgi:hypothetical protein